MRLSVAHAALAATPKGMRAASGGVSKAKTALFALPAGESLHYTRRGTMRGGKG